MSPARNGGDDVDTSKATVDKLRAVTDKAALKRDILRLADTPGLAHIVPSHGHVVSDEAASVLRAAANKYL